MTVKSEECLIRKLLIFFNRDGLDNSFVDDADLLVGGERSLSHRYENIVPYIIAVDDTAKEFVVCQMLAHFVLLFLSRFRLLLNHY